MKNAGIKAILKCSTNRSGTWLKWQKLDSTYYFTNGHWLLCLTEKELPIELAFAKELPQGQLIDGRISPCHLDVTVALPKGDELDVFPTNHCIMIKTGYAQVFQSNGIKLAVNQDYLKLIEASYSLASLKVKTDSAANKLHFYIGETLVGVIMRMSLDKELSELTFATEGR